MLRDARAKISFDLESEGSIVVVCSRGRRKEAGVARYKRRHSSLAISFLLSARARARARRPETQAPRGAWVSAPRLEGRETLQSSLGWWRFSSQVSVLVFFLLQSAKNGQISKKEKESEIFF